MTGISRIDVEAVLRGLQRVVARYGEDTRYEGRPETQDGRTSRMKATCRYVADDTLTPLCLIGVLLVEEFGVEAEALLEYNTVAVDEATKSIKERWPDALPPITPAALRVMGAAQNLQDVGATWGVALSEAVDEANGDQLAWEGK